MRNYKKTVIGSILLLILLLMSCLYPYYGPNDFNQQVLVKDEHGKIIDRAPFPPSEKHWLGTTRNGEDVHWLLLYGAKFTLITAFGVAVLRVLLGGIFGMFLSLWAPFLKSYFKDFFLTMRYIPSILIAFILMVPIVRAPNDVAISSIVTYQLIILVFIGFPSVTLFASDITDELLKTSFVQSSYLLGAGKLHIARRQLLPYMRSYGILFTVQQIISTLQITMQLSIFGLFLGGLNRAGIIGYDDAENRPKPASLSNEWAGLIGQNFTEFVLSPWIVFAPVFGFFLVIVIVNMIKKELEDNILGIQTMKMKRNRKEVALPVKIPSKGKFDLVN
ncbi:ABC transporter permease subunit [Neobacillus sp.]|uniref:ABC transporter permease subunit n=1 Tax=Neobacillus sp. TaxID=2675273 RepID=UPI0028A16CC8|nr:ABC transporter permease subunit [Neobacillus sp.]